MTKEQLQKEMLEKIKPGVKASQLKKLKKSKSADDISASTPKLPLKKSQSQQEIPLPQQPSLAEQNSQLKGQVKFHAETAANYLKSLQTSQAKVGELEKTIKDNPPNALLQDQLKEKQKEVESLRKKLENKEEQILELKHQNIKDFGQYQDSLKQIRKELEEQISDELVEKDEAISTLRTENSKLKQEKQSLQKDLNLAQRLAELRRIPYPEDENNWNYLQYPLYSLVIVLFTLWLTNHLRNQK